MSGLQALHHANGFHHCRRPGHAETSPVFNYWQTRGTWTTTCSRGSRRRVGSAPCPCTALWGRRARRGTWGALAISGMSRRGELSYLRHHHAPSREGDAVASAIALDQVLEWAQNVPCNHGYKFQVAPGRDERPAGAPPRQWLPPLPAPRTCGDLSCLQLLADPGDVDDYVFKGKPKESWVSALPLHSPMGQEGQKGDMGRAGHLRDVTTW